MRLFKCLCLGIIAILLCGCGENRAEFSPLNLGKVNVVYENQTLKIVESRANSTDSQNLVKNNSCEAQPFKGVVGGGGGSCEGGGGERLRNSSSRPLPQKNARGEKWESNADLSAQGHKENRDSSPLAQNDNLSNSAESSADSAPKDSAPFILFFFTSTCGVCKAQIPILEQLSAQGIKIYAILGDVPDISKASVFASAHKISLPLFYESGARRFFTRAVGGVKGVPVMAIFNNGKMKEKFIGLTPKSTLLRVI